MIIAREDQNILVEHGVREITYYLKKILIPVLGAIAYGWIEQFLFGQIDGLASGVTRLGPFGYPYHIPMMFIVFFSMAWPRWELIPVLLIVQDIAYFTFSGAHITENSWISAICGSFELWNNTIPIIYLLAIISSLLLYYRKSIYQFIKRG